MASLIAFFLATAAAYGAAFGYGVVLRKVRLSSVSFWTVVAVAIILACPLLIPASNVLWRALASLYSADLTFKVIELRRMAMTDHVFPQTHDICRFLAPFPFLLVVYQEKEKSLSEADRDFISLASLLGALVAAVVALGLFYASWRLPLTASHFFLDHLLKLAILVVFLEAFSRLLQGIERYFGYDTIPIVHNLLSARTVSGFWRLYNTRVHSWFYLNLFRPARKVSSAWAVVLVFTTNGLLHELMFGITTSRFDGFQLLFFLAQIPAVLVSRHLHRFSERNGMLAKGLVHCSTIAWMLLTTIFFFHGVNRIVPFYAAPPWLP